MNAECDCPLPPADHVVSQHGWVYRCTVGDCKCSRPLTDAELEKIAPRTPLQEELFP